MGASWTQVADPVRALHATGVRARGRFRIEHGRTRTTRLLARMLRLPRPAAAAEIRLIVTTGPGVEHWLRTFDGRRLETHQYEAGEFELAERFGLLEFRFHLLASDGSLLYLQREAAFRFGSVRLRVPSSWAPRIQAREDPAGPERVSVHVRVSLPGLGPLITYDGFVDVEGTPA